MGDNLSFEDQPRPPDALTMENIHQWASAYNSGVERGLQLAETEVGHPLPWARQTAKAIEPKPEPEPGPPTDL